MVQVEVFSDPRLRLKRKSVRDSEEIHFFGCQLFYWVRLCAFLSANGRKQGNLCGGREVGSAGVLKKLLGNRLIANVVSLFLLKGADYILPLITLPYLVLVLGPEKYGAIAFSQALIQYFVTFTDYGFNYTATKKISIIGEDRGEISRIYSQVMTIKGILMIIGFFILMGLIIVFPRFHDEWRIHFIFFLSVLGSFLYPVWFFQGMENMRMITIISLISRLLSTISIFAFVRFPSQYEIAAFCLAGNLLISGLISQWIIWHYFGVRYLSPSNAQDLLAELRDGAEVFVSTLAGSVYGQGAVLVTGILADSTAAGFFTVAQKVVNAIAGLALPFAQAFYPYLCKLAEANVQGFLIIRTRLAKWGALAGVIAGVLLFLLSGLIAKSLFIGNSDLFHTILTIFSLIVPMIVVSVLLNSVILAMGRLAAMRRMYLITALLFLAISIPATLTYREVGMSVAVLFVEGFVMVSSLAIVFGASEAKKLFHDNHIRESA